MMRKRIISSLTALAGLMLFCFSAMGQNNYTPAGVGYVNFTLGKPHLTAKGPQTVSLYGCNTRITYQGNGWNKSPYLQWGASNQILDSVPFGPQVEAVTGDSFFISKYYVAAPPVFGLDSLHGNKKLVNLGKSIPDYFSFDGDNPMQLIYFDYSRFKTVRVKGIPIHYDTTFFQAGMDILPINIDCKDFPWRPIDNSPNVKNVTGASGIGDLQAKNTKGNYSGLILPYYYTNKAETDSTFLSCEVTILNDIIPHYEFYFEVKGNAYTTINLTAMREEKITVKAIPRLGDPMPCGCKRPKDPVQCD